MVSPDDDEDGFAYDARAVIGVLVLVFAAALVLAIKYL